MPSLELCRISRRGLATPGLSPQGRLAELALAALPFVNAVGPAPAPLRAERARNPVKAVAPAPASLTPAVQWQTVHGQAAVQDASHTVSHAVCRASA